MSSEDGPAPVPFRLVQTPPREVPDDAVLDAVRAGWAPGAVSASYLPVGFGSHHWEIREDDGTRWFATLDELRGDAATSWLDAAFSVAHAAAARGVVAVHAPVPAADGRLVHRVRRAWVVTVQHWLEGAAGRFSDRLADEEAEEVVELLAGLHAVPAAETRARRDDGSVAGRGMLEALLACVHDPGAWQDGPLAPAVRELLAKYADVVAGALAGHDAVAGASSLLVVTHGEPHPGNLVHTRDGLRLVDWDTALLAPPERDLWLVAARTGIDVVARYEELTGRPVDRSRMRHLERRWALADVADFVPGLAGATEETDDTAWQLRALEGSLVELEGLVPPA